MTATATHSTGLNRTGLTLTRRGRLVLFGLPAVLLAAAVLTAAFFLTSTLMNQAQANTAGEAGVEAETVTVSEGQTLWSIASAADSGSNTQELIGQIAELNGLESSELEPGQVLHIPVD